LYKIFEDLGIEENDYSKLEKYISIKEKISTSEFIKELIFNKGIINLDLSSFTKRNINK
jgi:predicted CopG family antitoxin